MATGNEDSSVEIWDLLPPSQQQSSLNSDVRNLAAQIPLGRFDQDDDDDDELPTVAPSDGKNRRILRGHSEPVYDVAFRSGHHRNIILSSCYFFFNMLDGKLMTPYQDIAVSDDSQQLPHFGLGSFDPFKGPQPCLVRCFQNYREEQGHFHGCHDTYKTTDCH